MENMTLSELLRRKMHDYGYTTMQELEDDLGIKWCQVHMLLNGKTTCPRAETRRALCRVLDIAPDVLDEAIRNSMIGGR